MGRVPPGSCVTGWLDLFLVVVVVVVVSFVLLLLQLIVVVFLSFLFPMRVAGPGQPPSPVCSLAGAVLALCPVGRVRPALLY